VAAAGTVRTVGMTGDDVALELGVGPPPTLPT
jgi:hypothetical protein